MGPPTPTVQTGGSAARGPARPGRAPGAPRRWLHGWAYAADHGLSRTAPTPHLSQADEGFLESLPGRRQTCPAAGAGSRLRIAARFRRMSECAAVGGRPCGLRNGTRGRGRDAPCRRALTPAAGRARGGPPASPRQLHQPRLASKSRISVSSTWSLVGGGGAAGAAGFSLFSELIALTTMNIAKATIRKSIPVCRNLP